VERNSGERSGTDLKTAWLEKPSKAFFSAHSAYAIQYIVAGEYKDMVLHGCKSIVLH